MTPDELMRIRAKADAASTESLLAEIAHHVQNARRGAEPLGSVRVSILLLEVVRARLAREAASGN